MSRFDNSWTVREAIVFRCKFSPIIPEGGVVSSRLGDRLSGNIGVINEYSYQKKFIDVHLVK